jgi:hypothetical protein
MQAISGWAAGQDAAWERLGELTMPVFAANGAHDLMTDASNTYAMSKRLHQCDGPPVQRRGPQRAAIDGQLSRARRDGHRAADPLPTNAKSYEPEGPQDLTRRL